MKTLQEIYDAIDERIINFMHRWGVDVLRVMVGVVFLWVSTLKLYGASAVDDIVGATYTFLPQGQFMVVLAVIGIATGIGLLFNVAMRATLLLLWIQMIGTLIAPVLQPEIFFRDSTFLLLTLQGEFILKNIVIIGAGIVVGGHLVRRTRKDDTIQ